MFKHSNNSANLPAGESNKTLPSVAEKIGITSSESLLGAGSAPKPEDLRSLLEKNLKWSQIIYEQNRKINHKLLMVAVAGWLRFLIIAIPIALAIWFLPPFIKQLTATYGSLLNDAEKGKLSPNSLQEMIQMLPINSSQKEQIKNFLK
ncbi:MAG: hypothetical protein Q7K39_01270 [Candidatus Magasanikbacteria bacterium]|nr:hypothetical protein [Candidatus Magasanikbacteria bacterium]